MLQENNEKSKGKGKDENPMTNKENKMIDILLLTSEMDSDKSFLISSFSFLTLTEITQNPNNNDDDDNNNNNNNNNNGNNTKSKQLKIVPEMFARI